MSEQQEMIVRLAFTFEEAKAVDHSMAAVLESEQLIGRIYMSQDEPLRQARKGAMRLRQAIARVLDPAYQKDLKSEYIHRMQALTNPEAKRKWQPWTNKEKAYLIESDEHLKDIALALGRTFRGVKEMRKKLRRRIKEKEARIARKKGRK